MKDNGGSEGFPKLSLLEELLELLSVRDGVQGHETFVAPAAALPPEEGEATAVPSVAHGRPLSRIEFRGYKSLTHLDVEFSQMNILTGANNAGKSTCLSALQVLSAGMRVARRTRPTPVKTPDGLQPCYVVPTESLPVSLENVHSEYQEALTTVSFEYETGNVLKLWFPTDGGCVMYVSRARGKPPTTPSSFRDAFPSTLICVPVLGPLEHDEPLIQESTVRGALTTHRAARHFRNYWRYFPEGFERFASLVRETWDGIELEKPEIAFATPPILHMFCKEERITRELYWMGFGFQIWCQLLTHISRANPGDVLVVDEPETYLHPKVQRRLLGILRGTRAQVVVATHSAPLVMDAGAYEVFSLIKGARVARPSRMATEVLAAQLGIRMKRS